MSTYGTPPVKSACPARSGGWQPHETDAERSVLDIPGDQYLTAFTSARVYVCKHCGALYAVPA